MNNKLGKNVFVEDKSLDGETTSGHLRKKTCHKCPQK